MRQKTSLTSGLLWYSWVRVSQLLHLALRATHVDLKLTEKYYM